MPICQWHYGTGFFDSLMILGTKSGLTSDCFNEVSVEKFRMKAAPESIIQRPKLTHPFSCSGDEGPMGIMRMTGLSGPTGHPLEGEKGLIGHEGRNRICIQCGTCVKVGSTCGVCGYSSDETIIDLSSDDETTYCNLMYDLMGSQSTSRQQLEYNFETTAKNHGRDLMTILNLVLRIIDGNPLNVPVSCRSIPINHSRPFTLHFGFMKL
ncbi:Hypothetical protein POVR1_LOCUS236 [uncultured virus]|nr:Hypothetical protein POVR1_LOCUS236 [uncultured virus]